MAQVAQLLVQFGLRPCPVCGAVQSLTMSPFPVLLADDKIMVAELTHEPERRAGG